VQQALLGWKLEVLLKNRLPSQRIVITFESSRCVYIKGHIRGSVMRHHPFIKNTLKIYILHLVNKNQLGEQFIPSIFNQSLHVSGDYVLIIGRNCCVFVTLGTCYSVWITSTRCRINTAVTPDDEKIVTRNM
jgi:hypothetical protein